LLLIEIEYKKADSQAGRSHGQKSLTKLPSGAATKHRIICRSFIPITGFSAGSLSNVACHQIVMASGHQKKARTEPKEQLAMIRAIFIALLTPAMLSAQDSAEPLTPAPPLPTASLSLVREYSADEARQGAAADTRHVYAIANSAIGKYDKKSGALVARWSSPRNGPVRHLNSCFAEPNRLWCANSNFPEVPMGSSIELFDTRTMTHLESRSLGLTEEGSLTWFDRLGRGWIAGFAHYDERGGAGFKTHRYGAIVTYDAEWRRTGGWLLPEAVLERLAPHAASGGALGPDGLLYVMGHDRPEIYVLAKPRMGPVLVHLATFAIKAEGQAFAWDRSAPRRIVAISRPNSVVRAFDVPTVSVAHPNATRFAPSRARN
jgi:hypothetical protein